MLEATRRCCEKWGIAKVTDRRHRRRVRRVAGDASTGCSPAARTSCSKPCGCASWRTSSPSCAPQVDGADIARGPARAHRRGGHPRAARRRAPGADAGLRARHTCSASSPSRACRGSSASPPSSSPRSPTRTSPPAASPGADRRARPPHDHQLLPRAERPSSTSATRPSARALPRARCSPPFSTPARRPSDRLTRRPTMSITHRDNDEIIGRADINDIEAILSVTNTDVDEVLHVVKDNADALFTWDYSLARPQLRKLYEKAKVGQWNATTDLPWDTEVDLEAVVSGDQIAMAAGLDPNHYDGTVAREVGRQGVARLRHPEPQAGRCRSSSTVSRARCCAPPRSSRPCRGTTPSCTPPRRSSTRPATSRSSPATWTRRWAAATRSTPTCGCCSTTSSTTAAGT